MQIKPTGGGEPERRGPSKPSDPKGPQPKRGFKESMDEVHRKKEQPHDEKKPSQPKPLDLKQEPTKKPHHTQPSNLHQPKKTQHKTPPDQPFHLKERGKAAQKSPPPKPFDLKKEQAKLQKEKAKLAKEKGATTTLTKEEAAALAAIGDQGSKQEGSIRLPADVQASGQASAVEKILAIFHNNKIYGSQVQQVQLSQSGGRNEDRGPAPKWGRGEHQPLGRKGAQHPDSRAHRQRTGCHGQCRPSAAAPGKARRAGLCRPPDPNGPS